MKLEFIDELRVATMHFIQIKVLVKTKVNMYFSPEAISLSKSTVPAIKKAYAKILVKNVNFS